jgi:hypothetical protein
MTMDLDLRKAKNVLRSKMGVIILLGVLIVLIILGSLVSYIESSENTLKTNTINRHRIEFETVPRFEPRQ